MDDKYDKRMRLVLTWLLLGLMVGMMAVFAGCAGLSAPPDTGKDEGKPGEMSPADDKMEAQQPGHRESVPETSDGTSGEGSKPKEQGKEPGPRDPDAVQVVANPQDVAVLVNKTYRLPDNFRPDDLVEPNVPFIFKEKSEKRLLRKEAARALEALFAAARKDGIHLAGVSGFRSYSTQKGLFEHYVKTRGEAEARRFSAMPGHSEHQTGLAMDVSGSDGRCAAQDCFADTKEAKWLADHAHEYGFIIRYPKGKEAVTGYKYEPWHLRYVGKELARTLVTQNLTLDEYLRGTVPVSN
jgi:D-alanyl-D-alanine carboxypeptidase